LRIAGCGFGEIVSRWAGFDFGHRLEVGFGDAVEFQREAEFGEAVERSGEMIDRVVWNGQRAVASLVANFKSEVDDVFFADLNIV
jgi:hypothetical protein